MRVALFHGRGVISAAIRWQTRSRYSHAALVYPDGVEIVEAWQGKGVRKRALTDRTGVDLFAVDGLTEDQQTDALAFAERRIGAGYDYVSVLRFVTRRDAHINGRWFCSELVYAAIADAGLDLLRATPAPRVSPGLLARSPLLVPCPWGAEPVGGG